MKKILTFAVIAVLSVLFPLISDAQNEIRWFASVKMTDANTGVVNITAAMAPGWHLYGTELPAGGPKPTEIDLSASTGVKFTGPLKPSVAPVVRMDEMFGVELNWWEKAVMFTAPFTVTDPSTARIKATVQFMGCNDATCLPPKKVNLSAEVK